MKSISSLMTGTNGQRKKDRMPYGERESSIITHSHIAAGRGHEKKG